MKNSLIIVSFFSIGILLGIFNISPEILKNDMISNYTLYILMFLVGISIGMDKNTLKVIKKVKFKIILVPLTTIIGTFLGVTIISLFISSLSMKESLAVGAGFGYYSLSSILIGQISGKELAVIALIANIIREIITLLFTPLFVRYFGKLAPIVSGGATSMDTTLPIITEFSGKEYAIISVFHGTVLTVIVPFLVVFILNI